MVPIKKAFGLLVVLFATFLASVSLLPEQSMAGPNRSELAPLRIASGTIGGDEMLWLILKEADHLSRLVGVSSLADRCEYSRLVDEFKSVPYRIGTSLESLVKSRPDLVVLASFNRPDLLKQVEGLGVKALILPDFRRLEDIGLAISLIGNAIGEEKAAESVKGKFLARLERIRERSLSLEVKGAKIKVLAYFLDHSVIGSRTIFDDMIKLAGGENVMNQLGVQGWPKLSVEALMQVEPDLLVMSGLEGERQEILKRLTLDPASSNWSSKVLSSVVLIPAKDMNAISPYVLNALETLQSGLIRSRVSKTKAQN